MSPLLLAALETRARQIGNSVCTLASTETVRKFYRANGYVEVGPAPDDNFGRADGILMSKTLASV